MYVFQARLVGLEDYEPITDDGGIQFRSQMEVLSECRERIQQTVHYKTLKPGEQRVTLAKGKDVSTPTRDISEAGFDQKTFQRLIGFTSSYVHADGHAALQINTAKSIEAQQNLFHLPLALAQFALSKMSLELANRYERCEVTLQANPVGKLYAESYSKVATAIGDPEMRKRAMTPPKQE